MQAKKQSVLLIEKLDVESELLKRRVKIDCFLPTFVSDPTSLDLLIINDGQNLEELGLAAMLEELIINKQISPLLCVGVHAGDRKIEYGTACQVDYKGRGHKASLYAQFIFNELLPFIKSSYNISSFREKSFAGFSLGGLSALDIVWNYPEEFSKAGIFSGSLWWRTKGLSEGYNEDTDRIMHAQIRRGIYEPKLKFFLKPARWMRPWIVIITVLSILLMIPWA